MRLSSRGIQQGAGWDFSWLEVRVMTQVLLVAELGEGLPRSSASRRKIGGLRSGGVEVGSVDVKGHHRCAIACWRDIGLGCARGDGNARCPAERCTGNGRRDTPKHELAPRQLLSCCIRLEVTH